jgi:hypothetical protein
MPVDRQLSGDSAVASQAAQELWCKVHVAGMVPSPRLSFRAIVNVVVVCFAANHN